MNINFPNEILYPNYFDGVSKERDHTHSALVKLTYFKKNGKYYSDGRCYVSCTLHLFQIWDLLKKMFLAGKRPGLIDGHSEFSVLIDVPYHIHNHPHLMPGVA